MKAQAIVLIPTYNRASILKTVLKYLQKSSGKALFDICVVDNGSTDNTAEVVRTFKDVIYTKEIKNRFIAKALNNTFFKQKISDKYKYVVIMANDVKVNEKTMKNLLGFMQDNPKVGVSGPMHYDFVLGSLLNEGLTVDRITSLLVNCNPKNRNSGLNHFHSCFVVRTDAFKQVGGFRPVLFPMIYEEPDLGDRILALGYSIAPCRTAKIWHPLEDSTKSKADFKIRYERLFNSKAKAYLFFRNRMIYMRSHSNIFQFLLFFFIFNPLIFIFYLRLLEPKYLLDAVRGLYDGTIYSFNQSESFIIKQNKLVLNI
jgi:GT2 family glycosyltransferase